MNKQAEREWANGAHYKQKKKQLHQRQAKRKKQHFKNLQKKCGKVWLEWYLEGYQEGVSNAIATRREEDP